MGNLSGVQSKRPEDVAHLGGMHRERVNGPRAAEWIPGAREERRDGHPLELLNRMGTWPAHDVGSQSSALYPVPDRRHPPRTGACQAERARQEVRFQLGEDSVTIGSHAGAESGGEHVR
jgi:hypothetical protein